MAALAQMIMMTLRQREGRAPSSLFLASTLGWTPGEATLSLSLAARLPNNESLRTRTISFWQLEQAGKRRTSPDAVAAAAVVWTDHHYYV